MWTYDELPLRKDEKELFCYHYDVRKGGNVDASKDPHGELRNKVRARRNNSRRGPSSLTQACAGVLPGLSPWRTF